jgi:hypothetical protein
MLRKILYGIAGLVLVLLPIAGIIMLAKFSPYFNENTWGTFISVWFVYLAVAILATWLIARKTLHRPLFYGGFILTLIGAALVAVGGLGAPPDFGSVMLLHPDREHFRYIALMLAGIFFALGTILVLRHYWYTFPKWNRWIAFFLALSLIEMGWEFIHQYQTHDHLKTWVEKGYKTDDFAVNYFNQVVYNMGCVGRIGQYIFISWFCFILVQAKQVRIWVFIVITFFCILGLISAVGIMITSMHLPKQIEILMIMFIPASPLALLYWTGLAVLTNHPKQQVAKKPKE